MNFDGVITALERIELMVPKAQSVAIRNGIDAIKNRRNVARLTEYASLSGLKEMAELSRSGQTSPLGKCEKRMDIPMSERLEEALIAMAALNGIPKAEFARMVLEDAMFGRFSMLQMVASNDGHVNRMNLG